MENDETFMQTEKMANINLKIDEDNTRKGTLVIKSNASRNCVRA